MLVARLHRKNEDALVAPAPWCGASPFSISCQAQTPNSRCHHDHRVVEAGSQTPRLARSRLGWRQSIPLGTARRAFAEASGGRARCFHSFATGGLALRQKACGPPASWWIVCQPRTLTVPVPRNPLSGPPGFRGGTGGPRRGPGRGRI